MNLPTDSKWSFIVLPGLAMSLGWGLRGQIGHSTGAMIPGAFLALILCSLLPGKLFSRGRVLGLGAIALGYGATMTTQDTADLALRWISNPGNTLTRDFVGLAIKGGLWALFAGVFLGVAVAASQYKRRDIVVGMILAVIGFHLGWAWINKPRPVYFSVTRHETWGGFLVAAIVLLVWFTLRGHTKVPLVLGLCAAAAGAIGLPMGAVIGETGSHAAFSGSWYDWWKILELTFGAFMGMGIGVGTYWVRDALTDGNGKNGTVNESPVSRAPGTILGLAICGIFTVLVHYRLTGWLLFGSLLLCIVFFFPREVGWHVGITMTFYVTAVNVLTYWLHEQKIGNPVFLWALVWLATLAVAWAVTGWWSEKGTAVRRALVWLMWGIVVLTGLKGFLSHAVLYPPMGAVAAAGGRLLYTVETWRTALTDQIVLVLMALALTWLVARLDAS